MKIIYFGQSLIIDFSDINSPAKQTYSRVSLGELVETIPQNTLDCARVTEATDVSESPNTEWKFTTVPHILLCVLLINCFVVVGFKFK